MSCCLGQRCSRAVAAARVSRWLIAVALLALCMWALLAVPPLPEVVVRIASPPPAGPEPRGAPKLAPRERPPASPHVPPTSGPEARGDLEARLPLVIRVVERPIGTPAARARVSLVRGESELVGWAACATADEEGVARLLKTQEETRISVHASGFLPALEVAPAEPGVEARVLLERGRELRGSVVGPDGVGVPGALVTHVVRLEPDGGPVRRVSVAAHTAAGGAFTGQQGSRSRSGEPAGHGPRRHR